MLRRGRRRSRLTLIAMIAVIISGGWLRRSHATPSPPPAIEPVSTSVQSLPLNLAPPLDPGVRLVALVASDIDADGDLDLVANDGSLDLLVWINDGAGHLTRQHGRRTDHWHDDATTADSDPGLTPLSVAGSSAAHFGPGPLRLSRHDRSISPLGDKPSSLRSSYAHAQNPRGPPAFFAAL